VNRPPSAAATTLASAHATTPASDFHHASPHLQGVRESINQAFAPEFSVPAAATQTHPPWLPRASSPRPSSARTRRFSASTWTCSTRPRSWTCSPARSPATATATRCTTRAGRTPGMTGSSWTASGPLTTSTSCWPPSFTPSSSTASKRTRSSPRRSSRTAVTRLAVVRSEAQPQLRGAEGDGEARIGNSSRGLLAHAANALPLCHPPLQTRGQCLWLQPCVAVAKVSGVVGRDRAVLSVQAAPRAAHRTCN
ncbi:hypothetical protein TPAR_02462, partial [Tolypocladium paradoxum]